MDDADVVAAALRRVHGAISDNNVPVVLQRRCQSSIDAIYHSPDDDGGPKITVFRTDLAVPDEPWREVALLAHEFGHHMSFRRGWRTPSYLAALHRFARNQPLEDLEAMIVLCEECIAWRFGAWVLDQVDVSCPLYGRTTHENVLAYCVRMGLAETWADDADNLAAQAVNLALKHATVKYLK